MAAAGSTKQNDQPAMNGWHSCGSNTIAIHGFAAPKTLSKLPGDTGFFSAPIQSW